MEFVIVLKFNWVDLKTFQKVSITDFWEKILLHEKILFESSENRFLINIIKRSRQEKLNF